MDTFKTYNIYPMTTDNLQALLDYYFYGYKKTSLDLFVKDFFDTNITLKELELVAEKISRHIPLLERELGKPISQINILQFGLEAIKGNNWDNNDRTKERKRIIETVQKALTYRKLVWNENDINLDGKLLKKSLLRQLTRAKLMNIF